MALISIGKAAALLGVTVQTLRNWDKTGKLKPVETAGSHRRYDTALLEKMKQGFMFTKPREPSEAKLTIAYARVGHNQQKDLKKQVIALKQFCLARNYDFEIIEDVGSGASFYKDGLKSLLKLILDDQVSRLVITHKDRLLRFGAELVFSVCEAKNVEIVITNQGNDSMRFEKDLGEDLVDLINFCSARLYGAQQEETSKMLEDIKSRVESSLNKDN